MLTDHLSRIRYIRLQKKTEEVFHYVEQVVWNVNNIINSTLTQTKLSSINLLSKIRAECGLSAAGILKTILKYDMGKQ